MQEFEDHPCTHCGSIQYIQVEGSVDEEPGWECFNCGKEFIPQGVIDDVR
jgi:transposase-like protein